MAIDPLILLPAAALAVLIVILYIRLVAGRREVALTPDMLTTFLQDQEPDISIIDRVISLDKKYAIVNWSANSDIGVIRSFGNKLVLQLLASRDLAKIEWQTDTRALKIPRQGLAFPAVKFEYEEVGDDTLRNILKKETDAIA